MCCKPLYNSYLQSLSLDSGVDSGGTIVGYLLGRKRAAVGIKHSRNLFRGAPLHSTDRNPSVVGRHLLPLLPELLS